MLYTYLVALGLMAIIFGASGCGGSSKSTSAKTGATAQATSTVQTTSPPSTESAIGITPLTRAQLIARADPICRRANAKRAAVTISTVSSYSRLLPLAAYEEQALAVLSKLAPPPSIAHDWQLILGDNRTITRATAKLGAAPLEGRVAGARELLLEAANAERQMLAIAKRDGFNDCARFS